MDEFLGTVIFTAALVFVEFAGISLSKYITTFRKFEELSLDAIMRLLRENPGNDGYDGGRVTSNEQLIDTINKIWENNRKDILFDNLKSVWPGPELCYFTAIMAAGIFLVFSYADNTARKVICPILFDSPNASPVFVAILIFSLSMWVGTTIWRELIVSGIQDKARLVSLLLIMGIGCGVVGVGFYTIVAGR